MGFADELAAEVHGTYVRECAGCAWYDTLDDKGKAAFDDWVAAGKTLSALHRVAKRNGYPNEIQSFKRHIDRCHLGRTDQ